MNGNQKEAGNSRETAIFEARASEEKRLQLSQGHGEFGDVIVIQLEDALAPAAYVVTVDLYAELDQVPKTLDRGDKRSINADTENVFDVQDFEQFLRFGQWCHALCSGSTVL